MISDRPSTDFASRVAPRDLTYENLLGHLAHHNLKAWLLNGCVVEDAVTIGAAIELIPEHRLARRLARALAQ